MGLDLSTVRRRGGVIAGAVARNTTDAGWWRDIAVPYAVRSLLVRPYFEYVSKPEGVDMVAEDWDNLLILDGCRYDTFADLSTLPGRLESRRSPGAMTAEFLEATFPDASYPDIVYVSGNPIVDIELDDPFYRTVSVWADDWDDEANTVRPETMVEATLAAHERYPDKRIVSHFVQPHVPFIGERGAALGADGGLELGKLIAEGRQAGNASAHVWDLLQRGQVDEADVRAAYRENLALTLPHVETLLEELGGRSVVTADHGNLFGERPTPCPVPIDLYGHPIGIHTEALVKVPWLVVDDDQRRTVRAGDPAADRDVDTDAARERLNDLGYV